MDMGTCISLLPLQITCPNNLACTFCRGDGDINQRRQTPQLDSYWTFDGNWNTQCYPLQTSFCHCKSFPLQARIPYNPFTFVLNSIFICSSGSMHFRMTILSMTFILMTFLLMTAHFSSSITTCRTMIIHCLYRYFECRFSFESCWLFMIFEVISYYLA